MHDPGWYPGSDGLRYIVNSRGVERWVLVCVRIVWGGLMPRVQPVAIDLSRGLFFCWWAASYPSLYSTLTGFCGVGAFLPRVLPAVTVVEAF